MISTPKGKNWFYTYYIRGLNDNHEVISFKGRSVDNPYIDQNFINEQSKTLPDSIFRQEYLSEFTDAGSDVFTNVEGVCIRNNWDVPQRNERYYFGIDTGLTHDFSVLTILSESGRVAKIVRVNGIPFEEIGRTFITELKRYTVLGGYVESNSIGYPMFELIKAEIKGTKDFYTTNDTKNQGIRNLIYKIQSGELELPSKDFFPHLYNELNAYSYKINANGLITGLNSTKTYDIEFTFYVSIVSNNIGLFNIGLYNDVVGSAGSSLLLNTNFNFASTPPRIYTFSIAGEYTMSMSNALNDIQYSNILCFVIFFLILLW
jgi:hypothetical protein